MKVYWSI